ncbi:MAG: hypothetical protein CMJ31_07340 [Phycisphaerae bacterium]|nr:hypothetical protein [Phycisphaerae bacterium]
MNKTTTKQPRSGRWPPRWGASGWLALCGLTLLLVLIVTGLAGGPASPALALVALIFTTTCSVMAIRAAKRHRRAWIDEIRSRTERLGALRPPKPVEPSPLATTEDERSPEELLKLALDRRDREIRGELGEMVLAQATMRAIIGAVDSPVFAISDDGRVHLCNRAGERLIGRSGLKLRGLMLDEIFPSTRLLALHARAKSGVAASENVSMTFDGMPRVFDVAAAPARADIGDVPARLGQWAGVVLTLRDVTEAARAVQLKTDFVGNASHELRTPIASIRAAVETLSNVAPDDAEMHGRLTEMITNNVRRLEEMVADLLDLSHLESEERAVQRRAMPFSELALAMAQLFDAAAQEKRVELVFEADDALERLETDPKLIHLIVRNLIDNAIKFSFEDSEVVIEAEVVGVGELATERGGPRTAGLAPSTAEKPIGRSDWAGMRLRVTDRGQGIPLKHQPRIFERFYQVDQARTRGGVSRGTGLGLSIVKHATRRLGGEVSVDSVWQEGTTMCVEIPCCVRPA